MTQFSLRSIKVCHSEHIDNTIRPAFYFLISFFFTLNFLEGGHKCEGTDMEGLGNNYDVIHDVKFPKNENNFILKKNVRMLAEDRAQ